jgi:DNA ligase-1
MDQLAEVCESIAKFSSRLRKVAALADYLKQLGDDDFRLAVQFLSEGPVAEGTAHETLFTTGDAGQKIRLSIGHSILRDALRVVCKWDLETVRVCHQEVGDTGETIGLLVRGHTAAQPLPLVRANNIYQQLFRTRLTARKVEILSEAFRTYRPLTIKYFVKVITGNLRIGLQEKMVEEAVAISCGMPHERIREANNRIGDLARVAMAARRGELGNIEARLFHAMDFMLAKPLEHLDDLPAPENWIVEDKCDGIRSHVHIDGGIVRIYSRGMEEVTSAFPEIVDAFKSWEGSAILDGELLAWRNGQALSFNVLQQRIARKQVTAAMRTEIPVVFMAYDLLFRNGEMLLDRPLEQRRALLEQLTTEHSHGSVMLSRLLAVNSHADIDKLFAEARNRGNEGLLLKRKGSVYEPGKRSGAWYKLKRPYGTLDVVITAAEQGHGRRATVLSDYTFAVRLGEGFVNVGKAYSGLTDPEVKQLTKALRSASVDRFGRVMLVRPEVVLEVAFDGVQKSPRHKSGYALRFPRIVRWRQDKRPEEIDDLERVKELYEASLR